MAHRLRLNLTIALLLLAACSDNKGPSDPTPDASSPSDAGIQTQPDTGTSFHRDSSVPPEPTDAGFVDPKTIRAGLEIIDGMRIYVHLRGTLTSTHAPVFVLATGPIVGHEYLIEPLDFLTEDRLLVFYDLRATGRSGWGSIGDAEVTIEGHLRDVETMRTFVQQFKAFERISFIGHGFGASIAALYAAQQPDKVEELMLINPYPVDAQQQAQWLGESNARLTGSDRLRLETLFLDFETCVRQINNCSLEIWGITAPGSLCSEKRDLFQSMTFEYADVRGSRFIQEHLRLAAYNWREQLTHVIAPTTIIRGECDSIPAAATAAYVEQIPGPVVTHSLTDSGHFPMVESPEKFRELVTARFRSHVP